MTGRGAGELRADLLGHLAHEAQVERAIRPGRRPDADQRQLRVAQRVRGVVGRAELPRLHQARHQRVEAGLEHRRATRPERLDLRCGGIDADDGVTVPRERRRAHRADVAETEDRDLHASLRGGRPTTGSRRGFSTT